MSFSVCSKFKNKKKKGNYLKSQGWSFLIKGGKLFYSSSWTESLQRTVQKWFCPGRHGNQRCSGERQLLSNCFSQEHTEKFTTLIKWTFCFYVFYTPLNWSSSSCFCSNFCLIFKDPEFWHDISCWIIHEQQKSSFWTFKTRDKHELWGCLTALIVKKWSNWKSFWTVSPLVFLWLNKKKKLDSLLFQKWFMKNHRKDLPDTLKLSCQTHLTTAALRRRKTYKCKCSTVEMPQKSFAFGS